MRTDLTWRDAAIATVGCILLVVTLVLALKYLGPIVLPYLVH